MAIQDVPTPSSQPQILGAMINTITSRLGIKRFKVGGPILSILEAVSQSLTRSTYDAFTALQSRDIDNIEGIALQNQGNSEKIPPMGPKAATTTVTISDSRYTKIASNIYHGQPAPVVGTETVYVDATVTFADVPGSGIIYIGRGTDQQEGPLTYLSAVKDPSNAFWTLTLSTPVATYHNQGEEVVVGQGGDRVVNEGQTVSTASGSLSDSILYTALVGGVIPDGEIELTGIPVICSTAGNIGNVPQGAISDFGGSPPFVGATVTNPNRVTDGRDAESTKSYRERIKSIRNSKTKATDLAIKNAVINVSSQEEQKTILSSSIVNRIGKPSVLYIDDGNGYEPIYEGVGYEVLRDVASGGESDFQTISSPVVLACVECANQAPYTIPGGATLTVSVAGGTAQTHIFDTSVFSEPQAATAYDIASSINANSKISFCARVSGNATKITLYAKDSIAEAVQNQIQVTGGTANEILGFPSNTRFTSLLYVNDQRLSNINQYTLDRATGRLALSTPLQSGDKLSLGSLWTRGFVESISIPEIVVEETPLWAVVDGNTTIIDTGKDNVSALTFSVVQVTPAGYHVSVQNSFNFDSNVAIGQNLLLYKTANNSLPDGLVGAWKILKKPTANSVVIEIPCLKSARKLSAATNTSTGLVLICGGLCSQNTGTLNTVELYDPATGAVTQAAPMGTARYGHTATLLGNGKILVVGGNGATHSALTTTEVYDPTANEWTAGPTLSQGRYLHSALVLSTGNVLIAGGITGTAKTWSALDTSIEYVTASNTLSFSASFTGARFSQTLLTLPSGAPFMLGGMSDPGTSGSATNNGCGSRLLSTATYSAAGHSWSALASIAEVPTVTRYRNYVAAVVDSDTIIAVADSIFYTYTISTDTWSVGTTIAQTPEFTAVETAYNGTSIINEGLSLLTDSDFYFGRANQLVVTVNGTVVMPFVEAANSATGTKTTAHLYYDTASGHWKVVGVGTLLAPAPRSMFTCVAPTTTGLEDSVLVVGGQSTCGGFAGGESAIHATVDIVSARGETASYPSPLAGTYTGTQGWVIYSTQRPTFVKTVAGDTYTPDSILAQLAFDGTTTKVYQTSRVRLNTNDNGGDITLLGKTVAGLTTEALKLSSDSLSATVKSNRKDVDIPSEFMEYSIGSIEGSILRIPFTPESTFGGLVADYSGVQKPCTTLIKHGPLPLNGTICGLTRKNFGEEAPYPVTCPFTDNDAPANAQGLSQAEVATGREWGALKNNIAKIASSAVSGSLPGIRPYSVNYDSSVIGCTLPVTASPNQPVYCGLPYAFTKTDTLSVIVDKNTTSGLFSAPLYRKLGASDTTYSSQITVNDGDNGNSPLAQKFGIDYTFNNFSVLMKARNKLGNILYRFYRHGPEGENYIVRYTYPLVADQDVTVTVDHNWNKYANAQTYDHAQKSFIDISLPSGSAYAGNTLTSTTRINQQLVAGSNKTMDYYLIVGLDVVAAERSSAGGTTRLRVQYPTTGMADIFTIGNFIRFDAVTPTPTTLLSGLAEIVSKNAISGSTQDIFIAAGALDDGIETLPLTPNPGCVSIDPAAQAKVEFDNTIAVGDILVVKSPLHYSNNPVRITEVGTTNKQFIKGVCLEPVPFTSPTFVEDLGNPANITIFPLTETTEATVVAAVNALTNAPITATGLDAGATAITKATWDTESTWDSGTPLVDGYNAVLTTIIPETMNQDTQLTFKRPTTPALATNSDWENEEFYICPSYATDVVKWFNTPCVTGLWSQAVVDAADSGTSIQITSKTLGSNSSVQVNGAGANLASATVIGNTRTEDGMFPNFIATINSSNASGFLGNSLVKITNTVKLQKRYSTSDLMVTSISTDGTWTFDANTLPWVCNNPVKAPITTAASVEKAGSFTLVKLQSGTWNLTARHPGQFLYLGVPTSSTAGSILPNISNANKGVFRIANITNNGSVIWIENPISVEEKCILDFGILAAKSIVPGDTIVVNDDRFGVGNRGSWPVVSVGSTSQDEPLYVTNKLMVAVNTRQPQAFSGTQVMNTASVQVIEKEPAVLYKKLLGLNPNADNDELTDMVLCDTGVASISPTDFATDTPSHVMVSASAGSIITALNKLDFPGDAKVGLDAYKYHTGLVGEAKRVIYGDETDRQTYPGFVANGASVLIDGPAIKRMKKAFSVRSIGNPNEDLADSIRSVIAGVINSSPHGQNIPVTDIIRAAGAVDGVETITPLFEGDLIYVSAHEKAMVLNLREDIGIIFVGQ